MPMTETEQIRHELARERDELREQVIKATEQGEHWYRLWTEQSAQVDAARDALTGADAAGMALVKENERLRAAVEKHHELSDEEDDRSRKCSTCGLPWLP